MNLFNSYCGEGYKPMRDKVFETINQYIGSFPEDVQERLEKLRQIIKELIPEIEEKIGYNMPAFKLSGQYLLYFAAFKNHIGFYPMKSAITAFKNELSPYKQAKGSVQFPHQQPFPYDMIKKIIKFREKEILADLQSKNPSDLKNKKNLKRPRYSMPEFILKALEKNSLIEAYHARPPYQQNDYVGWIIRAVQDSTKQKRLAQMIAELKKGGVYMNMSYQSKKS